MCAWKRDPAQTNHKKCLKFTYAFVLCVYTCAHHFLLTHFIAGVATFGGACPEQQSWLPT